MRPNKQTKEDLDPLMAIFGSGRISGDNSQQTCSDSLKLGSSIQQDTAGSQSLFSSQSSSQGHAINEQIDLTLQLTEYVWVQCDNPDCQKWRRIPATEADELTDEPWYCHMNSDPKMMYCSVPEEDYARYDRMARKVGVKFIMSMLNMGSLVWAKMSGYCRWPALITRDPECGIHVMIDIDGDPHSYHVEFLGNPHSHSWVAAKCVDVYGHKDLPDIQGSQSQNLTQNAEKRASRGRGRGSRRGHGSTVTGQNSSKQLRKSYKRIHIEDVVEEADFLLDLSSEDRLKYITFKYDPTKQKAESGEPPMKKAAKGCDKCGHHGTTTKKQPKHKPQHTKLSSLSESHRHNSLLVPDNAICENKKKPNAVKVTGRKAVDRKGKENMKNVYEYNSDTSLQLSLDEGISVPTIKTEPSFSFESPEQFSQSRLGFRNTMVDKTKEEKFTIDINIYKKNEKAFEHDVHRFMFRNGQRIKNTPVWNNVPVRLFQLYLAVHERGGFLQVTAKKQWTAVYRELTELHSAKNGILAKKFYQRNLYPYELYITGKEYKYSFPSNKQNATGANHLVKQQNAVRSDHSNIGKGPVLKQQEKTDEDDKASLAQDIEVILGQLENDFQSTASQGKEKRIGSLGIKYHDESTPSFQDEKVPSEFQPASFTDSASEAQQVPEIYLSGGLSDVESKILHEMKAMEDDMKQLEGDLDLL